MYLSPDLAKLHIGLFCSHVDLLYAAALDANGVDGVETARDMITEILTRDEDRSHTALECLYKMLTGPRSVIEPFPTASSQESDINVDNIPSL